MPPKSFRPQHLELRYKTYYAVLTVPKDVRFYLGKPRFFKTTGTSDLRIAQARADLFVIKWQAEIAMARQDSNNPILRSALELNKIKDSTPKHRFDDVLQDEVDRLERETNESIAETFRQVASGESQLFESFLNGWEKHQLDRKLTTTQTLMDPHLMCSVMFFLRFGGLTTLLSQKLLLTLLVMSLPFRHRQL